jgi:8-oxo-dGTP pyrophosphatase MutT (NUDIX family)
MTRVRSSGSMGERELAQLGRVSTASWNDRLDPIQLVNSPTVRIATRRGMFTLPECGCLVSCSPTPFLRLIRPLLTSHFSSTPSHLTLAVAMDSTAEAFPASKPSNAAQILHRLEELHTRSHLHSSRTRRACVAMILRLRHPNDSPYVTLLPPPPKIKKARPVKKPATAAAHAASTPPAAVVPISSTPAMVTDAMAAATPNAAAPEHDVMTRVTPPADAVFTARVHSSLSTLAAQLWTASASLELLFMQRALNPTDRWSGQMSFPGGRQDKGETDEQTAMREVREEIGWDLKDTTKFIRLGQMDDKPMDGLKNVKPLAVGVFVFLQLCRHSPPMKLEPSEVSSVLFVPAKYFMNLRLPSDFGKIYHPLMLQVLDGRTASAATIAAAAAKPMSFDLRLIGWPHKREGKLMSSMMSEAALTPEDARSLEKMDQNDDTKEELHFSDIDDSPGADQRFLTNLRARFQALRHDLPLPHVHLPSSLTKPFLPRIEQLASLRFPALSLPGKWVDARGRGGVSTGDDIRTEVQGLMHQDGVVGPVPSENKVCTTPQLRANAVAAHIAPAPPASPSTSSAPSSPPVQCPPPFVLWGMTLEKTAELLYFLGFPFPHDYLASGSLARRRKYLFWTGIGEARWEVERQVEGMKHRIGLSPATAVTPESAQAQSVQETRKSQAQAAAATAPSAASAFAALQAASPQRASTSASSITLPHRDPTPPSLTLSTYSTPVLLQRMKQRAQDAWQKQKEKMAVRSKL